MQEHKGRCEDLHGIEMYVMYCLLFQFQFVFVAVDFVSNRDDADRGLAVAYHTHIAVMLKFTPTRAR